MPPFLSDVLSRAVGLTLGSYGQNWESLVPAIAISLIYWIVARWRRGGWRAVVTLPDGWKQRVKDVALSLGVGGIGMLVLMFAVNLYRASAARDAESRTKTSELTSMLTTLKIEHAVMDGVNQTLQKQNRDQQTTIDRCLAQAVNLLTPAQPQIKSFPITTGSRPGVPKMEYVLTTNIQRTPVDLVASCDFPIADLVFNILTESGGSAAVASQRRISARQHEFLISSPPWPVAAPLQVTIFFEPPVNRMPSCSFALR